MEAQIVFYMDLQEWQQMLHELDFLLRKCYGEDLGGRDQEIRMQVPNVRAYLLSMIQYDLKSRELELEVVKLLRGETNGSTSGSSTAKKGRVTLS